MNNFITNIIDNDLASKKHTKIITRFPPEPNGYLHIGHAKAICINFGIKAQYKGKCNLRFDDTNPVKEDVEYIDAIIEDIRWLGFNYDNLFYASDYFDKIYNFAVMLIKKGLAYVCDLSAEEIKNYRGTLTQKGKDSPYRNRSIEENLQLFTDMKNGKFSEGEKVLRAKIDMNSSNLNMRDPVLYRILYASHHRTKDKWCIYPMYDYTHPLSDAIEGITHSICTLEFEDHRPLYDWTTENCGFKNPPQQIEFARLNLTNTIMSKRFLKQLVDTKLVDGWDDPRMPTICGMRKRGYPSGAVKSFCEKIGVAKANSEVDFKELGFCVREYLNLNAERAMAILKPLKVKITNYSGEEFVEFEKNPNTENKEYRKIKFSDTIYIDASDFSLEPPPKYHRLFVGGYVRLKSAYIIKCDKVVLKKDKTIDCLECSYIKNSKSGEDMSGIKCKGVIQWIDAADAKPSKLIQFKELLDPQSLEENFIERINKNSKIEVLGMVEKYVDECAENSSFQFMRLGYYVKNKNDEYFETIGLKDSFKTD
ncbi:MAG: glutamine--tRNA ligase/YqeY domain fusion protein [Firmicutes bacterium]|nr:glutamine--tRNA ligase/YqeY domain fusion protein [Bacillota bacterium]